MAGRDLYWTDDYDGGGQNRLGAALMLVRDELLLEEDPGAESAWPVGVHKPTYADGASEADTNWQAVVDEVAAYLAANTGRR